MQHRVPLKAASECIGGIAAASKRIPARAMSASRGTPQWPSSFGRGASLLGRSATSRSLLRDSGVPAGHRSQDAVDRIEEGPVQPSRTYGTAGDLVGKVHVIGDDESRPLLDGTLGDFEGHSTFLQSFFNSVNILCGVGILAFPFALMKSGWVGLLFMAFLAIVTNYTGKCIAYCMQAQPGIQSYPEIGQAAYGDKGRLLISAILYTELFCTLSLFFILEGDNLTQLIYPRIGIEHRAATRNMFMALTAIVVLPTSWLRDLSYLSYVSVLGMISAFFLLGVVVNDGITGGMLEGLDLSDTKTFRIINVDNLPLMFGLVSFGFAGHAVFPNIYTSMKDKRQYKRMLDFSYVVVMIAYSAMAVFGWLQYRDDTDQQVTLNLPEGLVSQIATALICVNPITKFSLTLNPIGLGIEELFTFKSPFGNRAFSICIRSLLVFSSLIVAMVIPFFAYVLSFIGAFMTMAVSAVFPALCYMRLYKGKLGWHILLWNWLVVIIGTICAISGSWIAAVQIMHEWQKKSSWQIRPS